MAFWERLENVLIFRSNLEAFSALKLEPKIDQKLFLGVMLVQDDPKDHCGLILGPIFVGFCCIVGLSLDQSGIDVEITFATKPDRSLDVPYKVLQSIVSQQFHRMTKVRASSETRSIYTYNYIWLLYTTLRP